MQKITKKDKKTISGLVKGLPEMVSKKEKVKVTISGRMLLEIGIDKLNNGKLVDTNKVYLTEKPKPINHKTEAENAFKRGGIDAVNQYVHTVKSIHEKQTA